MNYAERAMYRSQFEAWVKSEPQGDFHGVDHNTFKFGGVVFEVIEDEDDGYRSALGAVKLEEETSPIKRIFFDRRLDHVKLVTKVDDRSDLYQLVSTRDGHVWLTFGTDDTDDYYPCFVFLYTPRAP